MTNPSHTFQTFQQVTPKTFHLRWRHHHRHPRSHHNRIRHTWRRRATSRMMSMRSLKKMTKTAPRDATMITRRPTHKTSGKRRLERFSRELKFSSWNRRLTWNGKFWWWFKSTEHKITINYFYSHTDTSVLPREPGLQLLFDWQRPK